MKLRYRNSRLRTEMRGNDEFPNALEPPADVARQVSQLSSVGPGAQLKSESRGGVAQRAEENNTSMPMANEARSQGREVRVRGGRARAGDCRVRPVTVSLALD